MDRRNEPSAQQARAQRAREDVRFAVCCIVVYVATSLADTLEAAWQGSFSDEQLAAFGIGEAVASYATAFSFMWTGVLARISRAQSVMERARTLRMGCTAAVVIGLPLMALVQVLARPLLSLFGPTQQVLDLAVPYLRVHLIGLVPLGQLGVLDGPRA